jgi:hypothetical protein
MAVLTVDHAFALHFAILYFAIVRAREFNDARSVLDFDHEQIVARVFLFARILQLFHSFVTKD